MRPDKFYNKYKHLITEATDLEFRLDLNNVVNWAKEQANNEEDEDEEDEENA